MDVLSDDPDVPEKHRGFCRARCAAKHRVRCLAFLVTFWAMPKSNRLAAGETKLCTCNARKQERAKELDSGLRRNDEQGRSGEASAVSSYCAAVSGCGGSSTR